MRELSLIIPNQIRWLDGFYTLEGNDENNWRWCSSEGTLIIINPSEEERVVVMSTVFISGHKTFSKLKIESNILNDHLSINNSGVEYVTEFLLPPGKHEINFYSNAERIDAPGDSRELYFGVRNFKLSQINKFRSM